MPTAVLTLLGLLLGFSFAMAVSRYEARRDLVVQEANFIDETARRAQLLPEPHAANVERLLREYVALRVEVHRAAQFSERFAALRKRTAELHLAILRDEMSAVGLDPAFVEVREVRTDEDAAREGFVGSPTIRVSGRDLQPPDGEPAGLTCRVYRLRDGRVSPMPDRADLRDTLANAIEGGGE